MNVKLIDRPDVEVVYLRHTGPYGAPLLRFWQQVVYPWMATNDLLGLPRYGISLDDPTVTSPEQCRYDAAIEMGAEIVLAGKPMRRTIAGGRYAALPFQGLVTDIAGAWDALLRDWLPNSGLQLDSRPFFEYYDPAARFDTRTGAFECDLCVPVTPL